MLHIKHAGSPPSRRIAASASSREISRGTPRRVLLREEAADGVDPLAQLDVDIVAGEHRLRQHHPCLQQLPQLVVLALELVHRSRHRPEMDRLEGYFSITRAISAR